ncbi:hypothetical protein L227DRAFT_614290 [Lentinus tigrinus ALCF2SS1-6]|uniref:Uncharacterized protein n=1 Tax=Lentinus tigrinus ALCF2SS1-6 TaxID=1328759 RepID=A0A5C2S030_9APHY|nr:hypothetical protein L227DRAFT_614290 [Lentinus tigrinus ALCF2SS1-6]
MKVLWNPRWAITGKPAKVNSKARAAPKGHKGKEITTAASPPFVEDTEYGLAIMGREGQGLCLGEVRDIRTRYQTISSLVDGSEEPLDMSKQIFIGFRKGESVETIATLPGEGYTTVGDAVAFLVQKVLEDLSPDGDPHAWWLVGLKRGTTAEGEVVYFPDLQVRE